MTAMVQVATAGDVAEAEELQEILRNAGIDSSIEQAPEDDAVNVLVPEAELETAQDAIEALTEPDDLISEPRQAREVAVSRGRAECRDAAFSVAPIGTAIGAPCVLASRHPSHTRDEHRPSEPA